MRRRMLALGLALVVAVGSTRAVRAEGNSETEEAGETFTASPVDLHTTASAKAALEYDPTAEASSISEEEKAIPTLLESKDAHTRAPGPIIFSPAGPGLDLENAVGTLKLTAPARVPVPFPNCWLPPPVQFLVCSTVRSRERDLMTLGAGGRVPCEII